MATGENKSETLGRRGWEKNQV